MSTAITTRQVSAVDIDTRVDGYDWTSISEHLDAHGWAMFPKLLTAGESAAVAGFYADDRHRRRIWTFGGTRVRDDPSTWLRWTAFHGK